MKGKKRILVIGPGMEVGGVERSLIGLLDALNYNQVEVDLFLFSHTGEFMPLINKNVSLLPEKKLYSYISVPILKLFCKGHFFAAAMRLFSKAIGALRAKFTGAENVNTNLCNKIFTIFTRSLQKEYDLALGFFGPHYFLERKVAAKTKIGWVHTDYSNAIVNVDVAFAFPMWRNLDYIANVSDGVKDSFLKLFPSLASKTVVIENILSPDFIRQQSKLVDVSHEMPEDTAVELLSVGRFCKAKGFDQALLACKKLLDDGLNIRWYFIGYGPDEQKLKRLISELRLTEYAIILGKKTNPYPYIKQCDIYVQPSRYEGKAVTVREAQALGKPVLITEFTTSHSQLQNGFDGHICPMGVDGIVDGVKRMVFDDVYRERLAQNASKYSYGNKEEVEKIYQYL